MEKKEQSTIVILVEQKAESASVSVKVPVQKADGTLRVSGAWKGLFHVFNVVSGKKFPVQVDPGNKTAIKP